MKSAYNTTWLHHLNLLKEVKHWKKNKLISAEQLTAIQAEYSSSFFHPNMMIRILLFIAALIAIGGVSGLFFLMFEGGSQEFISIMCIGYGAISIGILEKVFIQNARHYKSGVTEAMLYHAMGFVIGGIGGLTDFNEHVVIICCVVVFSLAAIRYHDLISTTAASFSLAYFIFFELYEMGGVLQQIIPFVMIIIFTPLYFFVHKLKVLKQTDLWLDCLTVTEFLSLAVVYAAGNYFVVRELSEKMMNLYIAPGEDIPFAFLFYFLTVSIPVVYLYAGIKKKDLVLLRLSLIALAFSVFTFKYYYSTGHHEVTFTVSGALLLIVSITLLRYLRTIRNGFTSENILSDKWTNSNAEAFIISQTLGGNKGVPTEAPAQGGGGSFGGGGASGEF
jgi:uncharacterized membrane protein YgcG